MLGLNTSHTWVKIVGGLLITAGIIGLILAPLVGEVVFASLWGIEPFSYIGGVLLILGLGVTTGFYLIPDVLQRQRHGLDRNQTSAEQWSQLTQQYFELFHHDLGRPLRRILGKEREIRALLQSTECEAPDSVKDLLDEIEGQAPSFRLMMANIQVLVQLESPTAPVNLQPVEPSELIRRIVDRYSIVAREIHKEITWWCEPVEFGLVYSDSSAIEHIVTNLVDNTVRYATEHIEIRLTKNPSHFFIRVWDDGPGIGPQYLPHLFDRGWTPEVARREEKTSSGLGLYIGKTLAKRQGGELTVESVAAPDPDHHTAFLLSLPLRDPA